MGTGWTRAGQGRRTLADVVEGLEPATDLDRSWGSGASVEGPAESILMAIAGRDVLDELSGDGVERLRR